MKNDRASPARGDSNHPTYSRNYTACRPWNYAARRRVALDRCSIIDTAEEPEYFKIVQLISEIFGVSFAAISFLEDNRQWFKSSVGLETRETPITQSFCRYSIESNDIMVVRDAREDPRFCDNPLVTAGIKIRFYAGMRLLASDGTPIGALCVFDPHPRPAGLTAVQSNALRTLAGQVETLLELRRAVFDQSKQLGEKKRLMRKLQHIADHDALTKLPHRAPFQRELADALGATSDPAERTALVLIDADHFKQVNDALGHDVGDMLLRTFARRLRQAARKGDFIARIGGDEFAVLLRGLKREDSAAVILKSLSDRLQRPLQYKGREISCQASLGLALYPDHARTSADLFKFADLALGAAKNNRGSFAMFEPELARRFERETKMISVAQAGLAQGAMVPFYQPKIDMRTGAVVGFEALVRCLQDGEKVLLPHEFFYALSDNKTAQSLGRVMMTQVLDDLRTWSRSGLVCGPVALNTCTADFQADDFAQRLLAELRERDLRADQIEIEVTESVFLGRSAAHVTKALARLHASGVRIALDDFGTGFASLTHLKQFPVDIIKIDRTFVAGIGRRVDDTSIVKAVIEMAHNLGLETIAEGVETFQQREFLKGLGCDYGQGFLYGEAIPASDVPASIQSRIAAYAAA